MGADDPVEHVRPEDRVEADPTPGMVREQAISGGDVWAGLVRTDVGAASGWHHHGECDSSIYVVSGRLRMESGPGGAEIVEAVAGDFLRVPPGAVHRESNPGGEQSTIVVFRAGSGPTTVNVDAPA